MTLIRGKKTVKKQKRPNKVFKIIIMVAGWMILSAGLLLNWPVHVHAYDSGIVSSTETIDTSSLLEEQMNSEEMLNIKDELDKVLNTEDAGFLKNKSSDEIIQDLISGKSSFSFKDCLEWLGAVLFREFGANMTLLVRIIVIVSIFAFLKGFQMADIKNGVSETAFYASYALVAAIMCTSFIGVMETASKAISTMVSFMNYTSPALFVLVAAGGSPIGAATLKPAFIFALQILANLLLKFFLPLFMLIAVLNVVDNLSDDIKVTNLLGLLKTIANWSLGICMTVFVALLSIQSIIASAADSVAGKTAKFAAGSFIPVVGKYLADSIDAVVSCASAIKNAAGVGMMIGIIAIFAAPAVKIFTISIMYRMTGALIEPVADKRLTGCIKGMAETMNFVAGVAAMTAVLLLISVSVIIKTVF